MDVANGGVLRVHMLALVAMSVWDGIRQAGIHGTAFWVLDTTRGDRLFISLLVAPPYCWRGSESWALPCGEDLSSRSFSRWRCSAGSDETRDPRTEPRTGV